MRSLSAHLRAWSRFESVVDALAVVRAFEAEYGAMDEFRFTRDATVRDCYHVRCHIRFRSHSSVARIPQDGHVLHVQLPPFSSRPGLADIQSLEPDGKRILDCKIERTRCECYYCLFC